MQYLAQFFIRNYKFTAVLSIFMFIFGMLGFMNIKSESYPAVDFASAIITTQYDGASALDVETQITKPIEDELRKVSGLKDVRSISQPGKSSIFVRGDIDKSNVKEVMADVERAIDRVGDLPQEVQERPRFSELKSEEFPVIEIAVVGDNKKRRRDIIADLLKEDIENNKDVLGVDLAGFSNKQYNLIINNQKLIQYHVGLEEVISKVKSRNINTPGGKLEKSKNQSLVRIEGKIESVSDLGSLLIRSNFNGKSIYLRDVATIEDSKKDINLITSYNGEPAVLMTIRKKSGSDTLKMVADLDKRLEKFKKTYKGEAEFIVFFNEALNVKNRQNVLGSNAISGLILVIIFLLIFLPGRIGLMASISLPLALMVTFGFMPTFGMNLDAITILAMVIALGMLVDNSVVISENYARLRSNGKSASDAANESVAQLWLPITVTVFTTIAAFLPMLVTKGIMGQFIKYIPIVVSIALIASLGESFFLLPMRLLKADANVKHKQNTLGWFDTVADAFEKMMRIFVRFRYLVALFFTLSLIGSFVMMTVFNKMILFPADQTEQYIARVELTKGNTLNDTNVEVIAAMGRIQEKMGNSIEHLTGKTGSTNMGPMDPKAKDGDNVGIIRIFVSTETRNNVSDTVFLSDLRSIPKPESVASISYEALINGPPVGEPVNVTFRSNNGESLTHVIDQMTMALAAHKGFIDIKVDDVYGEDQVYVKINYEKADQLGLTPQAIGSVVRSAISGRVVSNVNVTGKEIDLFLRLKRDQRLEITDIESLRIMDNKGNLIPIRDVAKVIKTSGKLFQKHFDFQRARTITANLENLTANVASKIIVNEFENLTTEDVSYKFGGEAESTNESMESLWNALVLSLIGIFALLVFLFNSFVRPLIIMSTIPLGLVGFSIAFALHGRPISFLALIGVIGLGGIIVNSGIILISFIDQLRAEGEKEVLVKASRLRLRAVLVSSLTTISGLIPTAYGIGGTDAMLVPMTLAMAWGLTSGTILTLVWVPCCVGIFDDIEAVFSRHSNKEV